MDIQQTEDDIIERLTAKLTDNIDSDVEIIPLPDADTELLPKFGKRRLIVAYNGDEAMPDSNISAVQQDLDTTFAIGFFGKVTRGEKGIYALKRKVENALIGFAPTGCQKLTYNSFKFIENRDKVFNYLLLIKTISVLIEMPDDEPTYPAFKELKISQ